jgi:hypothetical protein
MIFGAAPVIPTARKNSDTLAAWYLPRPDYSSMVAAMKTIGTHVPTDFSQRMLLAASLAQTAAIFYVIGDIDEDTAIKKAIEMYADTLDLLEEAMPKDSEK